MGDDYLLRKMQGLHVGRFHAIYSNDALEFFLHKQRNVSVVDIGQLETTQVIDYCRFGGD